MSVTLWDSRQRVDDGLNAIVLTRPVMMPVEWPIAAPAADRRVEPVRPAGRRRLDVVRADFFLDERHRLSEQERALMGAMLAGLVDQLVDELLAELPPLLAARIEPFRQQLAGRLWEEGALDSHGLVDLLLRRSDEQRIAGTRRSGPEGSGPVDQLVAEADEGVAVAAMEVIVARGRRRDRFGRVGIDFDDLDEAEAVRLVNQLAVAARIESGVPGSEADAPLAAAAASIVGRRNGDHALEVLVDRLAAALKSADGDDDEQIHKLASEGEVALLSALLAHRAGIASATGWCLMVEEGAGELMLLARLAGLDRLAAARAIAALAEPLGIADPASAIARYDGWSGAEVEQQRHWLSLPTDYRDALGRVEQHRE